MKHLNTLLMVTILFVTSCKKDDSSTGPEEATKSLPTITSTEITYITSTTAKSGGIVSNDGGAPVTSKGICWSTNENPTISNSKTNDGEGKGAFTSTINLLNIATKYYIRAYATNSVGTAYGNQVSFTTTGVTYNGFSYHTVTIGSQEWTVENLRTTSYNDGKPIPKVTDGMAWDNLKTGAYCALFNDESYVEPYGYLYNWYVIESGKLAPATGGWRVPTDEDWTKLIEYIGGESNAGTKLKAKSGWGFGGNGTDDYGFNALPGGLRASGGSFGGNGFFVYWWSSTAFNANASWVRFMDYNAANVLRTSNLLSYGNPVRLVRDK